MDAITPNSKKRSARSAVKYALATGQIIRPTVCERCGEVPAPYVDGRAPIQGHHYRGYDHKLDVEWLCIKCHSQETPIQNPHINKTHCPSGHPYAGDNLYVTPTGGRRCRTCARIVSAKQNLRLAMKNQEERI